MIKLQFNFKATKAGLGYLYGVLEDERCPYEMCIKSTMLDKRIKVILIKCLDSDLDHFSRIVEKAKIYM